MCPSLNVLVTSTLSTKMSTPKNCVLERSSKLPTLRNLGRTNTQFSSQLSNRLCSVVEELRNRFDHFLKTGDDSRIPPDLQDIVYKVAARHGGQAEWDKFSTLYTKAPTPSVVEAAMAALTSFQEDSYIKQTFDFIDVKARDQDLLFFFLGLRSNFKYRKFLAQKFKESYDKVGVESRNCVV